MFVCSSPPTGGVEAAALLLEKGADLEAVDELKRTPLHVAAAWGDAGLVSMFVLKYKANTGAVNSDGQTPGDVAGTKAVRQALNAAGGKTTLDDKNTAHESIATRLPSLEEAVRREAGFGFLSRGPGSLGAGAGGAGGRQAGPPSMGGGRPGHPLHIEETIAEGEEEEGSVRVRAGGERAALSQKPLLRPPLRMR